MSVAFRREDDDEHKEPKFAIPLPPGPNLVTARGLAMIRARVTELEAALAGAGDDAEAVAAIRRDLKYWNTRETSAEIAPIPDAEEVAFGSRVTYRLAGKEATVDLVGSDEAEPPARIPFTAPLAQVMIGLAPGESESFGERELEVVATGPIPD